MSAVNEFVGEVPGKEDFVDVVNSDDDVSRETSELKEKFCLDDWQGKEKWLC